jgi:DNA-directed RNA polymerase specialized sigma24 family protein/ribosome-associated translation inhibitor RaiA
MNVHISYKVHKTPDIEKEVNHHIEKLRKRLQVFRPELVHLKGVVEQSSGREGTTVSLNLRLPSGQMAVQKSAATASTAIKAVFDDLMQQTIKHKDLLRNSHKWARRRVADFRPEREVPFEKTVAAVQVPAASADDIRSYVNANLGRLDRFVERELYFRETTEQISPDCVTKNEVIDEAVARALGDGAEKPERLALEPWLYHLAIRAMDDLAARSPESMSPVPLEESVRKRNVRASDEAELQFHQPDETFTEESVIADSRVATPEDIAYSDEMVALMQFALKDASRADRESFILHTIEGFSVEEIAAITDRKREHVQTSIGAARECLRRALPASRFKHGRPQAAASD